jgi:hypothetical protein
MTKYCLPWAVRPVPGRNLDEDCPDITHAHFWMSGIATEPVARQLDLPTVLTFHGLGAHGLRRRMESKLARAVTWVSASCTGEASETDSDGPPTLVHLRYSVSRRPLRMGRRQPEAASIASLVWERYCWATVSTH